MHLEASLNGTICQAKLIIEPIIISGSSIIRAIIDTNLGNVKQLLGRYSEYRRQSILKTACKMAIFEINNFIKNSLSSVITNPEMLVVQNIEIVDNRPNRRIEYIPDLKTLYIPEPDFTNLLDIVSYIVIVALNYVLPDIRAPLKNNARKEFDGIVSFLVHIFPKHNRLMRRSFARVIKSKKCNINNDIKQFEYLYDIGALQCFLSYLCFIAKDCEDAPTKIRQLVSIINSYEKSRGRLCETDKANFYRFPSPARLDYHPEYNDEIKKTEYYKMIAIAKGKGKKYVYVFSNGKKQVVNFTENVIDCFKNEGKITKYKVRIGFGEWLFIALLEFGNLESSYKKQTEMVKIRSHSPTKLENNDIKDRENNEDENKNNVQTKRHREIIMWTKIGVSAAIVLGLLQIIFLKI